MNEPITLYNLMQYYIDIKEYDTALEYAKKLDNIVNYEYYESYVISEQMKEESNKDKCLIKYNKFIGGN